MLRVAACMRDVSQPAVPPWAVVLSRQGHSMARRSPSTTVVLMNCAPFVVPIFGDPLVPAAPRGPGQNTLHALLRGQHEAPEEATNLADAQRHPSPREALKAVRLLRGEPCDDFFSRWCCGQVGGPQHRQQRIGPHGQRDMPIPPRPTPYFILIQPDLAFGLFKALFHGPAAAGHLHDGCQRGPCGANTTYAVSSVGSLRLRRTKSHRRQWGCQRRGQGEPRQSYQRGLWPRRPHSTGTSPPPPAPPGGF